MAICSIQGRIDAGAPATGVARRVMAVAMDGTRAVLADGASAADGNYLLQWEDYAGPVLVVAIDTWGNPFTANTSFAPGDIIHPSPGNETGYVYECLGAGVSDATEPAWWVDDGGSATGMVGTASFRARQYYRPLAHGPIAPLVVAGELDPYWSNVVALLHFDGVVGSSLINDETGAVWLSVGAAQIEDAQARFSQSLLIPGGSYIETAGVEVNHHLAGDFTIEGWVFFQGEIPTTFNNYRVVACRDNTAGVRGWILLTDGDKGGKLAFGYVDVAGTSFHVKSTAPPQADTWMHVAVCRQGATLRLFLDGVIVGITTTSPLAMKDANCRTLMGTARINDPTTLSSFALNGFIDDFRITNGVARYAANFLPPSAPFPRA